MKDELERFIKNQFNITENTEFKFHEMCGLMFVFKQTFFNIDEKITSAEIKPVGIIYEESNEYYFAP